MLRPLTIVFLLFGFAAVVLTARAEALIFGNDDRISVSTEPGALFAPIGIVYGTPEAAYATAFLVSDCHVVTVQHAFGQAQSAIGRRLKFAAGVRGPAKRWHTTDAEVIAEGGLQGQGPQADPFGKWATDWVVLRLRKCVGRKFGHVRVTSRMPEQGEAVAIAGYPVDKPLSAGLTIDPSCHVRDVRHNALLHDCATLPGNSGGPLFRITLEKGQRKIEVFALNSAGNSFNVPGANLVLPVRTYSPSYAGVAAPLSGLSYRPTDPRN